MTLRYKISLLTLAIGLIIGIGCTPAASESNQSTHELESTITANVVATVTQDRSDANHPNPEFDNEAATVQSAVDLYKAENGTIASQSLRTNNLTSSTPALSPTYMRAGTTICSYTWDSGGKVIQHDCE